MFTKRISTLAGIVIILAAAIVLFGGVFCIVKSAKIKNQNDLKPLFEFVLNNNHPNGVELVIKNKVKSSFVQQIPIGSSSVIDGDVTLNDILQYEKDINFDGYKDLQLLMSIGSGGSFYDFYIYNPETEKFEKDPVLHDLADAVFTDYGTITTHNHYVCGGNYSRYNFNLNQNQYVLTQSKEFDCCNNNADRKVTIKKLTDDGKWATRNETCPVDSYSIDTY